MRLPRHAFCPFSGLIALIVAATLAGCAAPEPNEAPSQTAAAEQAAAGLEIAVSFTEERSNQPLDGRLLLLISTNDEAEPRFQIRASVGSMQVFGIDVEAMAPGEEVVFTADVFGYPTESLAALPPGDYFVQAMLHKYETFNLATGPTVMLWLPHVF